MTQRSTLPTSAATVFYGLMSATAVVLIWWLDLGLITHVGRPAMPWWQAALSGAALGLGVVGLSHLADRFFDWAKDLNREFNGMLGDIGWAKAFALAALSGIGEELLFRGAMQQFLTGFSGSGWIAILVTGLVFGLVHIGPDPKKFAAWTTMAIVLGWAIGALYLWTGNLVAPVVAHFTINFLNLATLIGRPQES